MKIYSYLSYLSFLFFAEDKIFLVLDKRCANSIIKHVKTFEADV